MSMLVDDLGQFLIDSGIAKGFGNDLFLSYIPQDPDNVIVLTEYNGLPSGMGISAVTRNVQIKVRNLDYVTGNSICWQIFNLFIQGENQDFILDINPNRFIIASALNSPTPLMLDDRDRQEFVFNLQFTTNRDV